ncbi:MAG: lactonase family protein [Terracidiphilus sp.]
MKLSKTSQLVLVSAIGLVAASFLTACQLVTIDYVFVACSSGSGVGSAGQIDTYAVDSESGALRTGGKPSVPSGGTDPVALAVTSNYYHLYVANQGNDSVVHFSISDVGVLTQKDSITTAQTPVYLAVNQANTYLYVISGTTSATLTEYSLNTDGTIGSAVAQETMTVPGFASDTMIPTGVATLPNFASTLTIGEDAVYVTVWDQSAYNPGGVTTSTANPGWLFGFNIGSGGALTATSGSPYQAGVKPTAVTADPRSRFLYVTDFASNELIGYGVYDGNALEFMVDGPFKTGNEPESIAVDPRGSYIYLANELSESVSSYSINLPSGTPSALVNSNSSLLYATDTDPVSLTIDPSLGRYVYTANHVGNSISGFRLNPNSGVLTATQASPYPTGANPTAIVAVPHGNHATQSLTP